VQTPADILAASGIRSESASESLGAVVRIEAARVADALSALCAAGYDFLVDLFATDTGEKVELTYHVRAFVSHEDLYVKALVDYDGEAPSVWRIFPAALFPEREAAELLGVSFPGHPNPKRLLTTDAVGPLLRKSVPVRGAEEVQRPVD
jgi:NADH-quinone oxidoreductase subunit C